MEIPAYLSSTLGKNNMTACCRVPVTLTSTDEGSLMRSATTAIVLIAMLFVVGCSQMTAPTAPTAVRSSVSATSSVSDGGVTAYVNGPPITPIWAQLNLVGNLLMSANHQLKLFFGLQNGPPIIPPNPIIPGNPVFPAGRNTLNFYLKANSVLDKVAQSGPPITPQITDALNAILREANTTLSLLTVCEGCPLLYGQITTEAQHTIQVATGLMTSPALHQPPTRTK